MFTIPQENRKLLILEDAKAQNNYFDCDVIQEAISSIEQAETVDGVLKYSGYLVGAIAYRGGKTKHIEKLFNELVA
jgi:hypothetical protein